MNYFKGFLFLIFISSALSENSENDLIDCSERPQHIGGLSYVSWRGDDTCIIIEYKPPLGYEHCDFQYEIRALSRNGVYNVTTDSLMHHFNYVKQKMFCTSISLQVTPILNGYRFPMWFGDGRIWSFYGVVGPVNSLDVRVTNGLIVAWTIPQYFEGCTDLQYHIVVTSVSGRILVDHIRQYMYEYIYDYASDNMFCEHVLVSVTAVMDNNGGTTVNKFAKLGGQGGVSC